MVHGRNIPSDDPDAPLVSRIGTSSLGRQSADHTNRQQAVDDLRQQLTSINHRLGDASEHPQIQL
jgi:hypothetical protein